MKIKTEIKCPICFHHYEESEITEHHLIPRCRGGKWQKISICLHCHNQIHAIFTEKELESKFNTLESLLQSDPLQKWIKWIRKHSPTGHVKTKWANRRRR